MTTIQRDALHAFVDRQLDRILATPVPPDMAQAGADEDLDRDEVAALWVAAGIASQIGLPLIADPVQFVGQAQPAEVARLAV